MKWTTNSELADERIKKAQEKEIEKLRKAKLAKEEELVRRKKYAALYKPKQCLGDPLTGDLCLRMAPPGSTICVEHGGTQANMRAAAQTRLLYLVEPALRTLNRAMASNNLAVAVRAAQIIMDRSGFDPTAILSIEDKLEDYSSLTDEQLVEKHRQLVRQLMKQSMIGDKAQPVTAPPENRPEDTIDGETVKDKGPSVH